MIMTLPAPRRSKRQCASLAARSSRTLLGSIFALSCCCWLSLAGAAEIQPDQALNAVSSWLRHTRQKPLATALTGQPSLQQSFRDEQGRALYHVAALGDAGFVVTSADDGLPPIVAFAARGKFPTDPQHPLLAILRKDMPARLAHSEQLRSAPGTRLAASLSKHAEQWQRLLAPYSTTRSEPQPPDDLRVPPLLQSTWGQDFIFSANYEKINVFNYYTPNHYVTGCVATVGAQLMRYHEYPTQSVAPQSRTCSVDYVPTTLSMRGGSYAWQEMPLKPDGSISDAQRQEIGKLLFDVAVSVEMDFTAAASSASLYDLSERLRDTFHFPSAKYFICWDDDLSVSDTTHYEDMLLSNLDAGYPVSLGIFDPGTGGHAVIGDGYGFHDSELYVHLNMGWDGYDDSWYNLPLVAASDYNFTVFDELLFNAFSDFSGEIISGRIYDDEGRPAAGAQVSATVEASQKLVAEATANERGIYALKIPTPNARQKRYQIHASFRGGHSQTTVDNIVSSNDYNIIDTADNDLRVQIGSRWGVDLQVSPQSHTVQFLLGGQGSSQDEDLLSQRVLLGDAAIPPRVDAHSPWLFAGWDSDFSAVSEDLSVQARYSYQQVLNLLPGWQLIGLGFVPDANCSSELAKESLKLYDPRTKSYARQSTLEPGSAYWLFRQEEGTITLSGDPLAFSPLPSTRGWHCVAAAAVHEALPASILAAWQWRDGRYLPAKSLAIGQAYWLYCAGAEH